jgi:sorbitol-6-phosphate 2-dehydrogenase
MISMTLPALKLPREPVSGFLGIKNAGGLSSMSTFSSRLTGNTDYYALRQNTAVTDIAPIIRMSCLSGGKPASVIALPETERLRKLPAIEGMPFCETTVELLADKLGGCLKKNNGPPGLLLVQGVCVFAVGFCRETAVKIADLALGDPVPSPAEFDAALRLPSPTASKRLDQKVIVITGGAQGFGRGLAEVMAENGAFVLICDCNLSGAETAAETLCSRYGRDCAAALYMDVTNENSVREAVDAAVRLCGGIDVFLANAGVLKAGAVDTLSMEDFLYVTNVNYTGYFLCVKYASRVMKRQNSIRPGYWMDIIQTNSKSGLTGSNKNCSYAGSKFGGIGLTQSFAMELAEFGIKVNSICPGNYLSGPLWSNPENGLFTQYLRTNKIKGAKTVDDLIRHYNSKVPMGRGCEAADVARAVLYLIEQDYETGQAFPVTGGQIMLR